MATPGIVVRELAKAVGWAEATVSDHDRNLRTAGLRSKSGRGRGAAKVTLRDAANLVTAIIGSGQVKDSVRTVQRYAETRPDTQTSSVGLFTAMPISELHGLAAGHSFIDALEALVGSLAEGSLGKWIASAAATNKASPLAVAPLIEVAAFTPSTVGDIRIGGLDRKKISVRYALPNPWDSCAPIEPSRAAMEAWEAKLKAEQIEGDLEQSRRITGKTLMRLADAIRSD